MTYVTDQTSHELRAHMRRLKAMPGWREPLADRLYKEILEQDAEIKRLRSTPDQQCTRCGGTGHELQECPWPSAQPVPEIWRPMATAPKDGTLVRLLVEFEHHATEDGEGPQPTIGSNTWENHHDFDVWLFAGWNWEQDCYTQGIGTPVGWMPMFAAQPLEVQRVPEPGNDQLRKFYGVATDAELIQAQERHIQKLQARLPPAGDVFTPSSVREG